jgi:hypothetical protein
MEGLLQHATCELPVAAVTADTTTKLQQASISQLQQQQQQQQPTQRQLIC